MNAVKIGKAQAEDTLQRKKLHPEFKNSRKQPVPEGNDMARRRH